MHIDREQTQRFMHGELDPPTDLALREHFAACDECRVRLEDDVREERDVKDLLGQLDHPRPALTAASILAAPLPSRPAWGRRVAAAILLLGAAGAAYAVPGSPVRGWVHSLIENVSAAITGFSDAVQGVDLTAPVETSSPESVSRPGGLGVAPGSSLIVVFETAR